MVVDWSQAATQLTHLGISPEEGFYLALFPPKDARGAGCRHIEVQGSFNREDVEQTLASLPGYSLGYIPNWGGTKNQDIRYCRALFYEDDGDSSQEEKASQWERAGLPHPSLQVWTGGRSVHNYWVLTEPCDGNQFRLAQKALFAQVIRSIPEAKVDVKLCNPARVMRLAGGTHPGTKEVSRVISATGERFPLEQLLSLCSGAASAPAAPQGGGVATPPKGLLSAKARHHLGHNLPRVTAPQVARPLPDRDTESAAYQAFVDSQEVYDREYRPQGAHYSALPFAGKVALATEALRFCPERLEPGSGTYGEAFVILAALVNEFGPVQALEITVAASWSQEHWDLEQQIEAIAKSSEERGNAPHKRIYHLFDTAEWNGWARPWPVLRELKSAKLTDEDKDLLRELRQGSFRQWSTSAAARLTLSAIFHPRIAAMLGNRADAFPVSHMTMLAPFLTTMASVLGKRYRVEVKPGWREPMVLWMGTVAPASSLKTPVANQFLAPLQILDARDQRNYKADYRRWKAQGADAGDPPELPRQRVVVDATLEGLCALLERENVPGVVAFHDELASFVGGMDKYRSNKSDRAHWLSMWSGGGINIVRRGSEPILVERSAVSVFGSIQQDKLSEYLHGDDAATRSGDGFWARFLWVVPEHVFPEQNLSTEEITRELEELVGNLDAGVSSGCVAKLDPEAWQLFAETADEWSREADVTYSSRSAFLGKLRGYLVRLAGLIHALDYAAEAPEEEMPEFIRRDVMERAVVLAKFFLCQFDVLAPQVGGSDLPAWVVKITNLAKGREDRSVTHRDVLLRKWAATADEARGMLSSLVSDFGVGRMVKSTRKDQVRWELGPEEA